MLWIVANISLGSAEHPIEDEAERGLWMAMTDLRYPFNRFVLMFRRNMKPTLHA
jgi:hypothetical protein